MRYIRLPDGSVYTVYSGDSNLSKQAVGQAVNASSNNASGKAYHPIHDIGALIGYYIPEVLEDTPSLQLNQSGISFASDGGTWFEEELMRIAKSPSNKQVLFQFLIQTITKTSHYTAVGVLDQTKQVFKYVDPHGRTVPAKVTTLLNRILPDVRIQCFGASQVVDSDDSGPIAVDNIVKLSHNEKLFNPMDFMKPSERNHEGVRKRVISDYMQGLRKSQREALARIHAGQYTEVKSSTSAPEVTHAAMNLDEFFDDESDPSSHSVSFSIDDT